MNPTEQERTYTALGMTLRHLTARQLSMNAAAALLIMMAFSTFTKVEPVSVGVAFVLSCLNTAGVPLWSLRSWILLLPVAIGTAAILRLVGSLVLGS